MQNGNYCLETNEHKHYLKYLKEKKFFCTFPFYHVYGEEDGNYKLCSEAQETDHFYNDMTIREWFTSDYINTIRDEMLKDDPDMSKLSSCKRCIKAEEDCGNSTRTELLKDNDMLKTYDPRLVNAYDYERSHEFKFHNRPLSIQMRMFKNNDVCNFGCYMCFPKFSSKRKQDLKKSKAYEIIKVFNPHENFSNDQEISMIDQFVEIIDYVNYIEIIGGEPLYVKESYDFLEELINRVDTSKVSLQIFTNLSTLENKERNFLNLTNNFKRTVFKVSLDGVEQYNEYIRKGSDWQKFKENIKAVDKHPKCTFYVWSVLSTLSILRYEMVEEWCKQEGIHHEFNILRDPEELSIIHLPNELKLDLIDKFSHHPRIVDALKAERDPDKFEKAIKYINKLDSIYSTKLLDVYPELIEYGVT